ncbi:MAG: terminase small subunit [Firmicutes bacterium]|nr:terminase small subunit [Bacillota bacterium]
MRKGGIAIEENEEKLNRRQRRFCQNIRGGMGVEAAARCAGYKKRRYGYELLGLPAVIKELSRPPDGKGEEEPPAATAAEIMATLTAVMRGEISEDAVSSSRSGRGEVGKRFRKAPTIKEKMDAASMLLKYMGSAEVGASDEKDGEAVFIVGEERLMSEEADGGVKD